MTQGRSVSRLVLAVLLAVSALACSSDDESLALSPDELPAAKVGTPYEATIAVARADDSDACILEVSSGALPPGVALQHAEYRCTATLEGTPETAGSFEFTIWASAYRYGGPFRQVSKDYRIVVAP